MSASQRRARGPNGGGWRCFGCKLARQTTARLAAQSHEREVPSQKTIQRGIRRRRAIPGDRRCERPGVPAIRIRRAGEADDGRRKASDAHRTPETRPCRSVPSKEREEAPDRGTEPLSRTDSRRHRPRQEARPQRERSSFSVRSNTTRLCTPSRNRNGVHAHRRQNPKTPAQETEPQHDSRGQTRASPPPA